MQSSSNTIKAALNTDLTVLGGTAFYSIQMADGSEMGIDLDRSLLWKARLVRSNAGAIIQFRQSEKSTALNSDGPMYIVGAAWEGITVKQMWLGVGQVGSEIWLQWYQTFDKALKFNVTDIGSKRSSITINDSGTERGIRVDATNGELMVDQGPLCFGLACQIVVVKNLNDNIKPWAV